MQRNHITTLPFLMLFLLLSLVTSATSSALFCHPRPSILLLTGRNAHYHTIPTIRRSRLRQSRDYHLRSSHRRRLEIEPSSSLTTSLFVRGGGGGSDETTDRPVTKVTIVGGTHGNEYTGVWCINAIEKQRTVYHRQTTERLLHHHHDHRHHHEDGERIINPLTARNESMNERNKNYSINASTNDDDSDDNHRGGSRGGGSTGTMNVFDEYPTLVIDTLLANPRAFIQNKRFVDVDLNREFSTEKLGLQTRDCNNDNNYNNNLSKDDLRQQKLPYETIRAYEIDSLLGPKVNVVNPNVDVVIDLHTTTSNMGITLIIPEGDALMSQAAAYVLNKCRLEYSDTNNNGATCLMHAVPQRADRMNLSSCGLHGFTIEVGPIPQGVLRHDIVTKTQFALHSLLEFLHLRNMELMTNKDDNTSRTTTTMLQQQLIEHYPNGIVQCYRSAPAKRPGELSGKIRWPIDTTTTNSNPNFPAWMVHESIQDCDYGALHVGDSLFVDLDGNVITYDGSHGDIVYLIFVNEGGYYYESSGTGLGVAIRSKFDLQTGWFVVESDDEDGAREEVVVEESDSYE